MTLKHNNPFHQSISSIASASVSTAQSNDNEEEELQKALAMSTENNGENMDVGERSLRASGAPPPSPEVEAGLTGPVFGPSEKIDEDGQMAMVPVNQVGLIP